MLMVDDGDYLAAERNWKHFCWKLELIRHEFSPLHVIKIMNGEIELTLKHRFGGSPMLSIK